MNQENIILKSDNGDFILTDRKVRYKVKNWGQLNVTSLMLDKITSLEIKFKSYPFLLVISALSIFYLIFTYTSAEKVIAILLILLSMVSYFATIKRAIIISSASTTITLPIKKLGNDKAIQFIDEIEKSILVLNAFFAGINS